MCDRRDLSSRQKASLARNSDISVVSYDRGANDLACAASHNRHLRFVAANTRAAQPAIEISLSGAQISARGIVKLNLSIKVNRLKFCGQNLTREFVFKIVGGISARNFTVAKQRVNFKFSRLLARRKNS